MKRSLLSSLAACLLPLQALVAQTASAPTRAVAALEQEATSVIAEHGSAPTQVQLAPTVADPPYAPALATAPDPVLAAPDYVLAAPDPAAAPSADPDFLFGAPAVSIGIRGGINLARAGSDLFDFMTDSLTLDRGDFHSVAFVADVAVRLTPRIDGVLDVAWAGTSARSEYRNLVDLEGLPIEQTTRFRRIPVTVGAKFFLTPRGRQVGQFAWIPSKLAIYAAGGGGFVNYLFEQEGAFVDYVDYTIFDATLESSGWAPTAYVALGGDLRLTPATFLSLEARRAWAAAELDQGFVDFNPIDLTGLQFTLGLHRSF